MTSNQAPLRSSMRWHLREIVASRPRLWNAVTRMRGASEHMVTRDTDLVLEGYPRSGNSFAEAAIHLLRPGLKIAHHRHVAPQLLLAVEWEVPAVLLVREPTSAAASAVFRAPELATLPQALRAWLSFHTACLPAIDSLIVADFKTTTDNFELIVAELNRRFNFGLPIPDKELSSLAYKEIERISSERKGISRLNYSSDMTEDEKQERRRKIEALRHDLETRHAGLVSEARALYERFSQADVARLRATV